MEQHIQELQNELTILQKQYTQVLDQLGQVTALKVKIEGAMEVIAGMIDKAKKVQMPPAPPQ